MLCYEIEGGKKCQLGRKRAKRPGQGYLTAQGRFPSLKDEGVQRLEEKLRTEQEYLMRMAA